VPGGFGRVGPVQHQIRPCQGASRPTRSAAAPRSALTIEPTRLPSPSGRRRHGLIKVVVRQQGADGPNASTWWTGAANTSFGAEQDRGQERAPLGVRAVTVTLSVSPDTGRVAGASRATALADLVALAEAGLARPSCTPGSGGLPTHPSASRAATASATASASPAGTSARRIAVHFCPAFTVISVTSWSTVQAELGVVHGHVRPRIEQFSESASALKRTARPATTGWVRSARRWPPRR